MAKLHLRHPLVLAILQIQVQTTTAAYTTKNSPFRYIGIVACGIIAYLGLSTYHNYISSPGYAARTLAAGLALPMQQMFDRLILRQWNYEEDTLFPVSSQGKEQNEIKEMSRWDWGSKLCSSSRYCGTAKEVVNVPLFDKTDPGYVPSKQEFIVSKIAWCAGLYFVNTLGVILQTKGDVSLISEKHVSFFASTGDVTMEESLVRLRVVVGWWMIQFAYLDFYYSLGALMSIVGSGDDVRVWRPLFGGWEMAFTIRNFWGKFWHQCTRLNNTGPSEFIAHDVFHLSRGTLLARYMKIFIAFLLSGISHLVGDYGGGVLWAQSGAIRFFCTQALGIMTEDGAQEVWRRMFGEGEGEKAWRKVLGYVWVVAFLTWSTPAWCFPVVRDMRAEDVVLLPGAWVPILRGIWA